jgi:hypothetical protein
LFLSLPGRLSAELPHLTAADIEAVKTLCGTMLGEAAFRGRPQLPKTNKIEVAEESVD